MGALSRTCPKPLLQVGRHSIVEHILFSMRRAGIEEVTLNLHHLAEQFPERLGDGRRYGLSIEYIHEAQPLGTAGTCLALAGRKPGQDILVHYGDIFMLQELSPLIHEHQARAGAEDQATLLVHQRQGSNSFAYFADTQASEASGKIDSFYERPKSPPSDPRPSWVFSGVCYLGRRLLAEMVAGPELRDLPAELFSELAQQHRLYGHRLSAARWAIDSPKRLDAARRAQAALPHTTHQAITL